MTDSGQTLPVSKLINRGIERKLGGDIGAAMTVV
jgi:hypothetical protein